MPLGNNIQVSIKKAVAVISIVIIVVIINGIGKVV